MEFKGDRDIANSAENVSVSTRLGQNSDTWNLKLHRELT
jgi:hypothetical protein